jgi:hypothetical protein
MNLNNELHALTALSLGKVHLIPTGCKAGWIQETLWSLALCPFWKLILESVIQL